MATVVRPCTTIAMLLQVLVLACVLHLVVSLCLYLWSKPPLLQAAPNEPWHSAVMYHSTSIFPETRIATSIGSSVCEQYAHATVDTIDGEYRLLIITMGFPIHSYSLTRLVFVPNGDNIGPLEWLGSTSWAEGIELSPWMQARLITQVSIVPAYPSFTCIINIVLWMCVVYFLIYALQYYKSASRHRRGCCPACGYPINIDVCSECGRVAGPRSVPLVSRTAKR